MSQPATLPEPRRIFMLGATGTIGRATVKALLERGHEVVCFLRPRSPGRRVDLPDGAILRYGDVTDPTSLVRDGFQTEKFDALVSCLASRTGVPRDAWEIDHKAHSHALAAAKAAGVTQVVLLSAICVQKPLLAFQQAKLAFEEELMRSGLDWSIVRPTAFFKSLSGQVKRLRQGRPFLVFGDGRLTACKPISDDDLGRYIARCLEDESLRNRILPIGGPGPAITPREQGEILFRLMGQEPRFRHVPVALLDTIIGVLGTLGRVAPKLRDKAELARIGRYYATESMLVLDPATGRYDADATPSTGRETLEEFYARLLRDEATVDLGEHAVF
ncbi:NAD(P)H-binding protein [Rhodobacter sp. NSM]|uniref:NAD(P)H-binding protein n=1 Tax=Rhodobacter sp. NSM TaxID=3457501 RepID=UPI003FCFCB00